MITRVGMRCLVRALPRKDTDTFAAVNPRLTNETSFSSYRYAFFNFFFPFFLFRHLFSGTWAAVVPILFHSPTEPLLRRQKKNAIKKRYSSRKIITERFIFAAFILTLCLHCNLLFNFFSKNSPVK